MSATARKERPILFRPELVRKILDGKKTQTRRPLGLLSFGAPSVIAPHELDDGRFGFFDDADGVYVCKFGRPGDVLWVREAFTYHERHEHDKPLKHGESTGINKPRGFAKWSERISHDGEDYLVYRADGKAMSLGEWEYPHPIYEHCAGRFGKVTPSIHMPRWACRLLLEITDVRVERVQDISEADAIAEGMEPWVECYAAHPLKPQSKPRFIGAKHKATCREAFEQAWSATYPGSWDRNDWVWVISFLRTEA